MLDNVMQIIGGIFYLLNKMFLSVSERQSSLELNRKWKIYAWSSFLIGLPAWLIILTYNRNWIAACLEASGGPSMVLGLLIAIKGKGQVPKLLDYTSVILIPIALGYSLYDFGGITTINQVYEIGTASGFLIGTYLLAKEKVYGYLWYLPMHGFAGLLMYEQNYLVLCLQQLLSLLFVLDAYWQTKKVRGENYVNEK